MGKRIRALLMAVVMLAATFATSVMDVVTVAAADPKTALSQGRRKL